MSAVVSFWNIESIHASWQNSSFCLAGSWKRSCRNFAFYNHRTNCRGGVWAPTLLSQPFLELYGENIWVAVRRVCISIAKNPSIIGVLRLGCGSITVLQHCLALVPSFSLAPLIFFFCLWYLMLVWLLLVSGGHEHYADEWSESDRDYRIGVSR